MATHTLPNAPSSSSTLADDQDQSPVVRPQRLKTQIVKSPPRMFTWEGTYLRDMLPSTVLPSCVNPRYVDCNPNDLPLCWYGVPFDSHRLVRYAKDVDLYVPGGGFSTWFAVHEDFRQETGIKLRLEHVWGIRGYLLVVFCNRNKETTTSLQYYYAKKLVSMMQYEDNSLGWYLDEREKF